MSEHSDQPADPVSEAAPPDALGELAREVDDKLSVYAADGGTPLARALSRNQVRAFFIEWLRDSEQRAEAAERDLADARRERDELRAQAQLYIDQREMTLTGKRAAERERDESMERVGVLREMKSAYLNRAEAAEATLARLREALCLAREALDLHDEWCGYNRKAPGHAIWNKADRAIREALAGDPEGTPLCDPRCGGSISTWHVATCPNAPAWLKGTVSPAPALSLSMTDDPLAISALLDDSTRERERYHRIIARIREVLGEDGLHAQLLDLPDLVAQKLAVAPCG